ncbi:MAG: penicillin-binding protein [Schlesneria sp.]|nr:penicillin-binding protein [Schlesneria sp.]
MDRSRRTSAFKSSRVYRGLLGLCAQVRLRWRVLTILCALSGAIPAFAFIICWHVFPFPWEKLDSKLDSVLVTDRSGRVLIELVGPAGQRQRRVPLAAMSPWLSKAIVAIEDERFESHWGVDFCAVIRATGQNLHARRKVSGASTITMQLCKMIDERPRTCRAKLIEAFRALQLEQQRSKPEILARYLNLIPCGGNLRGVEAASQAYFGKSASELSLAEAALLAGLPQSPNRFAPDRHPDAAKIRRNAVLNRMLELGNITQSQHDDAIREPIAVQSRDLKPAVATHAAWMALAQWPAGGRTAIEVDLQREVEATARSNVAQLPEGADLAVVVVDVATREIVSLVGSANDQDPIDGQVNGATARRSPGSTLKPLLYAAAFEARRLSPDSLVDDVAIERAGWSPENFDRTYRGSVSATEALRQSLNVPAITITEGLGLPRCLGVLNSLGLELPADSESRGGLAVATGGLEVNLLELTNAYATIACEGLHQEPILVINYEHPRPSPRRVLSANVCRAITSILSSQHRCPNGWGVTSENSPTWFAWKTGTSSGRRDAWAIGHNGRYAIGVWVGNFHGGGHLEFVGRETAEPILSRLFQLKSLSAVMTGATYEKWEVQNPLPRPVEAEGRIAILSPRNDAAFLTLNGTTIVHPTVSCREAITWFHNGQVLTEDDASRLIVSRGSHELRAVSISGQSASVQFIVK